MKSFTDIKQSKRLAKILPLESADMGYIPSAEDDDGNTLYTAEYKSEFIFDEDCIPCWSLAALLSILPRYLNYNDDKLRLNLYTLDFENLYRKDHCWIVGYWDYDEECETYNFQIQAKEDEIIDACVELIENLHNKMVYDFNKTSTDFKR